MLSPADADLVRRDPALPGLATLLDPDAFADRLRRALPGTHVGAARDTYLRYKPGTNCLVSYRVEAGGEEVWVHAKAYTPDARSKLEKARKEPGTPGTFGVGRLVLEDIAVTVTFFPNDRKLETLPHVGDPGVRERLLRERLPGRPDLWGAGLEGIRYKPERRYVARLLGGGEAGAMLKVYTGTNYRAARANAEAFNGAFEKGGPFRLAPLLGRSDRHRVLIFEWLPGRPLDEAILDPGLELREVANVGAGLAGLHAQEPEGLATRDREDEAGTLCEVAEGVGLVSPDLAGRSRDLARRLAARLLHAPPENRPIHGDFDAGQVLLDGDTITLLDLDRAVRGDPAEDLGMFFANLERAALLGGMPPGRAGSLREALLTGYGNSTGGSLPERIDTYTAAGLLRLAPEPFRYRSREWPEQTERMLDRAAEILEGGLSGKRSDLRPAKALRAEAS